MSRRPRRNHSPVFKAKVAIDALADGKTIAEIAHKTEPALFMPAMPQMVT